MLLKGEGRKWVRSCNVYQRVVHTFPARARSPPHPHIAAEPDDPQFHPVTRVGNKRRKNKITSNCLVISAHQGGFPKCLLPAKPNGSLWLACCHVTEWQSSAGPSPGRVFVHELSLEQPLGRGRTDIENFAMGVSSTEVGLISLLVLVLVNPNFPCSKARS